MVSIIGVNELFEVQEIYAGLEIEDNCEQATLTLESGCLRIALSEEYPEIAPIFSPNFPGLDNGVIKTLLESVAENMLGKQMLSNLFDELETSILPDLLEDKEKSAIIQETKRIQTDCESSEASDPNPLEKSDGSEYTRKNMRTAVDAICRIQSELKLEDSDFEIFYASKLKICCWRTKEDGYACQTWAGDDTYIRGYSWRNLASYGPDAISELKKDEITYAKDPCQCSRVLNSKRIAFVEAFHLPRLGIEYFDWRQFIAWDRRNRNFGTGKEKTARDFLDEQTLLAKRKKQFTKKTKSRAIADLAHLTS